MLKSSVLLLNFVGFHALILKDTAWPQNVLPLWKDGCKCRSQLQGNRYFCRGQPHRLWGWALVLEGYLVFDVVPEGQILTEDINLSSCSKLHNGAPPLHQEEQADLCRLIWGAIWEGQGGSLCCVWAGLRVYPGVHVFKFNVHWQIFRGRQMVLRGRVFGRWLT